MSVVKSYFGDASYKKLQRQSSNLLNSISQSLGDLRNTKIKGPAGVYLIARPISNEIVYVGTSDAGIFSRLHQHRYMIGQSDLKIMIRKHKNYSRVLDAYRVRFIAVKNKRERIRLEHFLIALLNPPLNTG